MYIILIHSDPTRLCGLKDLLTIILFTYDTFLIQARTRFKRAIMLGVSLILSLIGCHHSDFTPSLDSDSRRSARDREVLEHLAEGQTRQLHQLSPDVTCAQCHRRQALEYESSTMRYSFVSPAFNALELALNQVGHGRFTTDGVSKSFCARCHGPRAVAEGLTVVATRESVSTMSALEAESMGIGCDTCHTVDRPHGPGEALSVHPSEAKVGPSETPAESPFHSYTERPESRSFLQSSDFCGACHDVRPRGVDVETGEDHLRSEDLFSEWARSPWAQADHPQNPMRGVPGIIGVHDGREAEGEVVTCQDCHMSLYPQRHFLDEVEYTRDFAEVPVESLTRKAHKLYPIGVAVEALSNDLNGVYALPESTAVPRRISSHRFVGVSRPLLPFPRWPIDALPPDTRPPEELMMIDPSRTSVSEAYESRRIALLRAAVTLSNDEVPRSVSATGSLSIPLWIENIGAGHNVPAGFSQEREMWVALTVEDQGRSCEVDLDCADLIERRFFLASPNQPCVVHHQDQRVDPALPPPSAEIGWEEAARRERSGLCGEEGYCQIYRSGYLIDIDDDGLTDDEDLRHTLIELDPTRFEEACVLAGPDADLRLSGVQRGLIWFTNALQQVATDERGAPIPHPQVISFAPLTQAPPPRAPPQEVGSIFAQPSEERRHLYDTQRALYERSRYLPMPREDEEGRPRYGFGLTAPHLLSANRAFNGASLRPFEPRLALYEVPLLPGVVGPLKVSAKVRFRFFSPRLLRLLAQRAPHHSSQPVTEEMIDRTLHVIDMAEAEARVEVIPTSP